MACCPQAGPVVQGEVLRIRHRRRRKHDSRGLADLLASIGWAVIDRVQRVVVLVAGVSLLFAQVGQGILEAAVRFRKLVKPNTRPGDGEAIFVLLVPAPPKERELPARRRDSRGVEAPPHGDAIGVGPDEQRGSLVLCDHFQRRRDRRRLDRVAVFAGLTVAVRLALEDGVDGVRELAAIMPVPLNVAADHIDVAAIRLEDGVEVLR